MSYYGVTFPGFWDGPTGVAMARAGAHAQVLAHYLISCESANMIGLYELALHVAERQIGSLSSRQLVEAFLALDQVQFAHFDDPTQVVWVREMAMFRLGLARAGKQRRATTNNQLQPADHRVVNVRRLYAAVKPNPFLPLFYAKYRDILHLDKRRGFKGAYQPLTRPVVPEGKPDLTVRTDLTVGTEDQERSADQEQRFARRFSTALVENPRLLVRLAHDVLDQIALGAVHPSDAKDSLKERAALARVYYDATEITKALASAEHQRARTNQRGA